MFLLGHVIQVGQEAQLGPFLDIQTLDLGGGGRIAGYGAGLQYGHGRLAAATGHGEILPGITLFFEHLLEGGDGTGFTAGGPPMQDLHLALLGHCEGRQAAQDEHREETLDHFHSRSLFLLSGR